MGFGSCLFAGLILSLVLLTPQGHRFLATGVTLMWCATADLNVCSKDACVISQLFAFLKSLITVRRSRIGVCFDWQVVVLTS